MAVCWICRVNEGTTGEHKTKRSDLAAVMGAPLRGQPYYYHDAAKTNQQLQGLNSNILKSPILICAECNNERTQPYDLAWERMSDSLRNRFPPPRIGRAIKGNRIFRYDTRRRMTDVHLYFLKLFGGMLEQIPGKPIDTLPFSKAIMSRRPHKEVYLDFGKGDGTIGSTDLRVTRLTQTGHLLAFWQYELAKINVLVAYAQSGADWRRISEMWHPLRGTNNFVFRDLRPPKI